MSHKSDKSGEARSADLAGYAPMWRRVQFQRRGAEVAAQTQTRLQVVDLGDPRRRKRLLDELFDECATQFDQMAVVAAGEIVEDAAGGRRGPDAVTDESRAEEFDVLERVGHLIHVLVFVRIDQLSR
jgi:hypothetical protein